MCSDTIRTHRKDLNRNPFSLPLGFGCLRQCRLNILNKTGGNYGFVTAAGTGTPCGAASSRRFNCIYWGPGQHTCALKRWHGEPGHYKLVNVDDFNTGEGRQLFKNNFFLSHPPALPPQLQRTYSRGQCCTMPTIYPTASMYHRPISIVHAACYLETYTISNWLTQHV